MSRSAAFAALVYTFTVVMVGTTMPTPIYGLYQQKLGFSVFIVTVIFAAYAVGVLGALLAFGRWSDALGRRKMLLAGIAFGLASALVFAFAGSLAALLVGRVLSGISAGIFVGTATVALLEMVPEKWRAQAPFIATAANIGGLGLGPLVAGLLVEFVPNPLQTPFFLHIGLLVVAAVAVVAVPETVDLVPGARPRMQRLSVPPEIRGTFIRAAIAGFAGFAVLGLFSGVSPGFMTSVLGIENHLTEGAVVFSVFASSAAAQVGLRFLPTSLALKAGCLVLAVGVLGIAASLELKSLWVLVVSAIVCGIGQGVTFSKGMASITAELPPSSRAEVTSTFFVVLYVAISVPVIGAGALATVWGLVTAGLVFSILVAALAIVAFLLLIREQHVVNS